MSIVRFGQDSDVAMYVGTAPNHIGPAPAFAVVCAQCSLHRDADQDFRRYSEASAHLKLHAKRGQSVPLYAWSRLATMAEIGDMVRSPRAKS